MFSKHINKGFTLVEAIVALAIFMVVLGISHSAFIVMMRNVSNQSRQAQSNIEGIIGLELLRSDIASAGYGLPWNPASMVYLEADDNDPQQLYNQTGGAPLAVQGGDDVTAFTANVQLPGTDYLVLRATNLATNAAAHRWSYMTQQMIFTSADDTAPKDTLVKVKSDWPALADNFAASDRVSVLTGTESQDPDSQRSLVSDVVTTFNNVQNFAPPLPNLPTPPHPLTVDSAPYFVYGISADNNPRMPYNRADYYVRRPTTGAVRMSQRCAPNTGILFKGLVSHADGQLFPELPLLDCVADFQVVYDIDPLNNGSIVTVSANLLAGLTASQIRNQLKNIQVYILTHDGKRDEDYTYPNAAANPTIGVGPASVDGLTSATGRTFAFNTIIGDGWEHYRWKVYRIVITPKNLFQDQK